MDWIRVFDKVEENGLRGPGKPAESSSNFHHTKGGERNDAEVADDGHEKARNKMLRKTGLSRETQLPDHPTEGGQPWQCPEIREIKTFELRSRIFGTERHNF